MVIGYSHSKAQKHRNLGYNLHITTILVFLDQLQMVGYNEIIRQHAVN